ncbi:MAG: undecaprenyl-diphosphate phosphatase [Chthoniobacterales bacterium]
MPLTLLQIIILGLVQGAAELLPVSSSAHVIVAEKLMRLDPSSPEMTFLLVMLHTGTMFAVIVYFWKAWRESYFSSAEGFKNIFKTVVVATGFTLALGFVLKKIIEKILSHGGSKGEVEQLFSRLPLIAAALAAVGVLIIISAMRVKNRSAGKSSVTLFDSICIGIMQAICLPFRGFSRSGATISTGLLLGISRRAAEEFSFALAVVLTPAAIAHEGLRLIKAHVHISGPGGLAPLFLPGLLGMICSFVSGLVALWLLSSWLEKGRWGFFGYYCIIAAGVVFWLAKMGY